MTRMDHLEDSAYPFPKRRKGDTGGGSCMIALPRAIGALAWLLLQRWWKS